MHLKLYTYNQYARHRTNQENPDIRTEATKTTTPQMQQVRIDIEKANITKKDIEDRKTIRQNSTLESNTRGKTQENRSKMNRRQEENLQ